MFGRRERAIVHDNTPHKRTLATVRGMALEAEVTVVALIDLEPARRSHYHIVAKITHELAPDATAFWRHDFCISSAWPCSFVRHEIGDAIVSVSSRAADHVRPPHTYKESIMSAIALSTPILMAAAGYSLLYLLLGGGLGGAILIFIVAKMLGK
jgi:hypothetical protein